MATGRPAAGGCRYLTLDSSGLGIRAEGCVHLTLGASGLEIQAGGCNYVTLDANGKGHYLTVDTLLGINLSHTD